MTFNGSDPIRYLRGLADYTRHEDVAQMIRQRDHVIGRYQPVFSNVARLDPDEFAGFLQFENNLHWWGLHRDEARLVSNVDLLRWALETLLDEERPLAERIDEIDPPHGSKPVPGLDKAIYTPILLISAPDSYGVWNSISESAMQRLGLWPDLSPTSTTGEQYVVVNEMLETVAAEVRVDLWTLDALWWGVEKEHDPAKHFRARRTPPPTRSTTTGATRKPARTTSKSTARKPAAATTTFLCENCFQQKQLNLQSPDDPNRCIDCG
jgi:hypothetical protein